MSARPTLSGVMALEIDVRQSLKLKNDQAHFDTFNYSQVTVIKNGMDQNSPSSCHLQ